MNPRISMIAALSAKDRAIGKDNQLLWHIPDDLRRFKTLTTGHTVIMGENTYRSIGRALPNRINLVLSFDMAFSLKDCIVVRSIDEALARARELEKDEIFIIGGASIYRQFLPLADRLYLTLVEGEYEADTYFPDYEPFSRILSEEVNEKDGFRYRYVILERE